MKLVLQTQNRENYGYHDWDGQGECPQYWKFKGGNTYVVHGVSVENAQDSAWYDNLSAAIEWFGEAFEEYIIGSDLVDECDYKEEDHVPEWESPINMTSVNGVYRATRLQKMDFVVNGITEKSEEWIQTGGGREDYTVLYGMEDGRWLTYAELQEAA